MNRKKIFTSPPGRGGGPGPAASRSVFGAFGLHEHRLFAPRRRFRIWGTGSEVTMEVLAGGPALAIEQRHPGAQGGANGPLHTPRLRDTLTVSARERSE